MHREIDNYIEEVEESSNGGDNSLETPDIGEYCLAKFEDKFRRGKVIGAKFGENILLEVFFVDFGNTIETEMFNVYNIPIHLLKRIPFQVWRIFLHFHSFNMNRFKLIKNICFSGYLVRFGRCETDSTDRD